MIALTNNLHATRLIVAVATIVALLPGCTPSLRLIKSNFYDSRQASDIVKAERENAEMSYTERNSLPLQDYTGCRIIVRQVEVP